MTEVKIPTHPEIHSYAWTKLELAAIKQYGDDRAREALEMAAKVCETQDEVGPSFPNRWECASGIRALAKEIQE